MSEVNQQHILHLYKMFNSPLMALDCGEKCSVYNEYHIPFCCDTRHIIPMAYCAEWDYLTQNTELWHLYQPRNIYDKKQFEDKTPEDQVLVECQGHHKCQRPYRTLTCRSFPFFPYIDQQNKFIGLSYYWEYEDRCWVINHLEAITPQFRDEFVSAFDYIFLKSTQEFNNFRYQSIIMRRVFGRKKRAIPLILRNGSPKLQFYKITPNNGRMRKVKASTFKKHGVYYFAEKLPFPEE